MKLIIFDLDGTLLNTLQDLTDSVNYAMDELKLDRYNVEQVRMMVGNGVAKLMERAVTPSHAELSREALRLQRSYYLSHYGVHTAPYDGVRDMLSSLKSSGFIVAVHTNKDENVAKKLCLEHFGRLVDYVCGTTDGITKPNPLKIERLMSQLELSAKDAVYCGDSDVDIATARNLGIDCISAAWGFRGADFLKANGAKILAYCPKEVVCIASGLF